MAGGARHLTIAGVATVLLLLSGGWHSATPARLPQAEEKGL